MVMQMVIGSRMRWVGLLVFGAIMFGNASSFGQLPNDKCSPIQHLGRMQGFGWGDGYHSCNANQIDRFRHGTPFLGSASVSSLWLPTSSVSTLHPRPSEYSGSTATLRFRPENKGPMNASPMNAGPENASKFGGWNRPAKHGAGEAKCGPWFGYCPENKPLFGQPVALVQPIESASGVQIPVRR